MGRLHLVELEDLEWFPAVLRDGATAFLRAIEKAGGLGDAFVEPLADAMKETGHEQIIDLCSGGAGPLPEVVEGLSAFGISAKALMTDKYPNLDALERVAEDGGHAVSFESESVDATDVPEKYQGFRTLFNAFHHFPPSLAKGIIADAVKKQTPIGIFEIVERSPQAIMSVCAVPLGVLLLMPTIRPVRSAWWFYTYILPLIPALVLFDGLVSCMRVYSPKELQALIEDIEDYDSFNWSIVRKRNGMAPAKSTIMIGTPKKGRAAG